MAASSDWDRYWSGRGQVGEAFLGEGVERHPGLEAFWREAIGAAPEGPLLDVAAGAGSVAKVALALGRDTHAADVSPEAMKALSAAHPQIPCTTASADTLPLKDGAFGVVTSQFGIEYAPEAAFDEALRVVRVGGALIFLMHHQGGAIEAEVKARRISAEALQDSGLFEAATKLATALYRGDFEAEKAAYDAAEQHVMASPSGLAAHTIQGFRQLATRYQAYDLVDITGWLEGMRSEAEAFLGRMRSMEAAARSAEDVARIKTRLEDLGAEVEEPAAFHLDNDDAPAAWVFKAKKP